MVIAYHLTWTIYGSWLPNDPRGSTSPTIRSDLLTDLATLHQGRKRIQPCSQTIRDFYHRAEPLLKHPILKFSPAETHTIASTFQAAIHHHHYTCYACAIMPDHIHVIIRKHRHKAEEMITHLQAASHLSLRSAGLRDLTHPIWGGPGWKVFLDTLDEIRRTIKYVNDNPAKARLPEQHWSFVQPYDGWPIR